MKHWKAYIKITQNGQIRQFEQVVEAANQFEAVNQFRLQYGQDCIIGWIRETKLYGLQSVSS